jgi:DNA-binding Lrp family transcriptional regulator
MAHIICYQLHKGVLDHFDIQILQILTNDARRSYRSIGIEIGLTANSVKTRVLAMVSTGVIQKFLVSISPSVLGYKKECLIVVRNRGQKKEVLNNLKLLGDVVLEVQSLGGFSAFRLIIRSDSEDKVQFLADAIKPAVVETMFVSGPSKSNTRLSKTDLAILRCLVTDPRIESSDIAQKLRISARTITRRLHKLQDTHAVKFGVLLDPASLRGYILFAVTMNIKEGSNQKILANIYSDLHEYFLLLPPSLPQHTITVLFLSKDVFTADRILEKIESYEGVKQAEFFLPTKIILDQLYQLKYTEEDVELRKSSQKILTNN